MAQRLQTSWRSRPRADADFADRSPSSPSAAASSSSSPKSGGGSAAGSGSSVTSSGPIPSTLARYSSVVTSLFVRANDQSLNLCSGSFASAGSIHTTSVGSSSDLVMTSPIKLPSGLTTMS